MKILLAFLLLLGLQAYSQQDSLKLINTYEIKEIQPIFLGGDKNLLEYFQASIQIPQSTIKAKYRGLVKVKFSVLTNGIARLDSINLEKMTYGKHKIDEEHRIIAKSDLIKSIEKVFFEMPKWIPGYQNDIPVIVVYTLPFKVF